jgi:hypothetical protein
MPLWYVIRGDTVWAWTFAASQKVRNLERDPREPTDEMRPAVAAQAAKRVGLEFGETQRATWDHRKLSAGTY